MPNPYIGQILLYALAPSDVDLITSRRTNAESVRNRLKRNPPEWPEGAHANVGDPVTPGERVPLIVTRVDVEAQTVSGHVLLNGSDQHWVVQAAVVSGEYPGPGEAVAVEEQLGLEVAEGAGRKPRTRP